MAYQPKSYRKFLATSVTAAMVATVAAPFATPAQAAANFPDVPADHWAAEAIDYLVEKGALEGRPNGTFDPTASITRGEAAKILAITLGLEVDLDAKTDFADAANHWASPYIAAIQAQTEDVINGYENGTFRPNNNITRQEMAKMVVTAYGLELNEEADVSFNDNTGWGAEYVSVLASLGIVEGISAGSFAPNGLVTRAQTPVFVHRTEVPAERLEVPTKEPVAAAVESVSAINATQVEVKFTTAVDKSDAELAANSSIQGVTIVSRSLSADGKVLTLTAQDAIDVKDAAVVIEPIKTKADTLVKTDKYVSLLTYKDEVAPTIASVEAKTNSTRATSLTVKASEPVKSGALVKVNGSYGSESNFWTQNS